MTCRCAVIQCVSTDSLANNLSQMASLIDEAAMHKADMVVLPENFAYFASGSLRDKASLELNDRGPVMQFLSDSARKYKIFLVGGSTPLIDDGEGHCAPHGKVFSACVVFDSKGNRLGQYNKMHLFDADVADGIGAYRESHQFAPGNAPKTVETPWGNLGLSICYDMRFPEYYRKMASQDLTMVAVPAAFTYATGKLHWEILLRARAIENQVFVLASNQGGEHHGNRKTWGHSMIIDPLGEIKAERKADGPGVVVADLDMSMLTELRANMPVLSHRTLI